MSESRSNLLSIGTSTLDLTRAQKFRTVPPGLSATQIAELTGKFALDELYTKDVDGINAYKDNIPTFLVVYKIELTKILNRQELATLTKDLAPYRALAEQTTPLFHELDVEDNHISLAHEITKLLDGITVLATDNTISLNDNFNALNKFCLEASITFPSLHLLFTKLKSHPLAKTHNSFAAALDRISVSPGVLIRPIQKFAHMNSTLAELIKRAKNVKNMDAALLDRLETTNQLFNAAGQEMNQSRFLYELVNIVNQIKKNLIQRVDPDTNPLVRKLTTLAKNMLEAKTEQGKIDREKVTQLFMSFYVDSYLEYRTKNYLQKTKKPPFLKDLEICIVQQENLKHGALPDTKYDKLIFKYINTIPTLRSAVIKQLFTRATAEGLGNNQKQIYINAIKEAARLAGDDPIEIQQIKTEWDTIAVERGLQAPQLQLTIDNLSENAIAKNFETLRTQEVLISNIKIKLAADIFISLLKNDRPKGISSSKIDELDTLVQELQASNTNPEQMHHIFMHSYSTHYFHEKIYNTAINDPTLAYMENALKTSGISHTIINPAQRLADLTSFVINTYADAYIDGRTKSVFGKTSKTAFLTRMEKNILEVFHLTLEANQKPEEMIMQLASTDPQSRRDIVNALFSRAMAEGISMGHKDIFINVTKLVVRMGSGAIDDWNTVSAEKFKAVNDGQILLMPKVDTKPSSLQLNENFLVSLYELIYKNKTVTKAIKDIYTPNILLLQFTLEIRNPKLTSNQRKRLLQILEALKETQENRDEFRNIFISAYLDAYINERKQRSDGELLNALEKIASNIKKITGNEFLMGNPIKKGHMDAEILSSVTEPAMLTILIIKLMGRAIDDIQRTSDSPIVADKQTNINSFINCIKAVVRMRSIERWDNLASERGLTTLTLGNLVNSKNELNEKTIKTFTEKLLNDETLLQISVPDNENIVRHHISIDSTVTPRNLVREHSMSISVSAPTSPGGFTPGFFKANIPLGITAAVTDDENSLDEDYKTPTPQDF